MTCLRLLNKTPHKKVDLDRTCGHGINKLKEAQSKLEVLNKLVEGDKDESISKEQSGG